MDTDERLSAGNRPPDSPPGAAPRSNRRATGWAVGITLAVIVVATVAGWIVVPQELQGLVTLLALVAAVTLGAAIALPRWPERLWPILVFAFVAIGTVLMAQSGVVRAYGFIAILLAFTVFPVFAVTALAHLSAWAQDQPTPPLPRPRKVALSLGSGAMIAATAVGFIALEAQRVGQYVVIHGQPVTVSLGQPCQVYTESLRVTEVICPDSQWTMDGETHRGTVYIGPGELDIDVAWRGDAHVVRNRTIDAYAIPGHDRAFTQRHAEGGIDGLHVFYVVPWWLILAGPLLVVVLILGAIVRRILRRTSSPAASPSAN